MGDNHTVVNRNDMMLYPLIFVTANTSFFMDQSAIAEAKSLKGWQVQHILKGREQARLQEFVTEPEWRSALQRVNTHRVSTKHSGKS